MFSSQPVGQLVSAAFAATERIVAKNRVLRNAILGGISENGDIEKRKSVWKF